MPSPTSAEQSAAAVARYRPWYAPFVRLLRATAYITSHTAVALVLIGAITLVEGWIHALGDPILFGKVPLRWFFDAMDAAILLVFLTFGTVEAIRAFTE
jgi:hypothetical protein